MVSSFSLGPLPDAFARAAWSRIAAEISASPHTKARLEREVLRLHGKSSSTREAVKCLGVIVDQKTWSWPRGEGLLAEQLNGGPVQDTDRLEALWSWFVMATNKLWRRGQIRTGLKGRPGRKILVSVGFDEGEVAPCGLKDGDQFPASDEMLKRIPPCSHPFCSCSWILD